jgi:hypothetical protein
MTEQDALELHQLKIETRAIANFNQVFSGDPIKK